MKKEKFSCNIKDIKVLAMTFNFDVRLSYLKSIIFINIYFLIYKKMDYNILEQENINLEFMKKRRFL